MAQRTLEKNSLLKYFDILKDKFFKIILLNMIFFTSFIILLAVVWGLNALLVHFLGTFTGALQLLELILFLPLIALGPVTGAIMKLCRDFVREEPGFFWEDFKKALKDNWKQCTIIASFQYIAVWAIYIATNFYLNLKDSSVIYLIGLGVTLFVAIAFIFASYYFYMMAVTLKLSIKDIIKNSFIFTMLCFIRNILLTLVLAVWIGLIGTYVFFTIISSNSFLYGIAIAVFMVLFFGIIFYTIAFFTFPPIKKHILDPYYEEHPLESSAGLKQKINSDEINFNGSETEQKTPDFVYHNGKMVHRSALEEQQVFKDESNK